MPESKKRGQKKRKTDLHSSKLIKIIYRCKTVINIAGKYSHSSIKVGPKIINHKFIIRLFDKLFAYTYACLCMHVFMSGHYFYLTIKFSDLFDTCNIHFITREMNLSSLLVDLMFTMRGRLIGIDLMFTRLSLGLSVLEI